MSTELSDLAREQAGVLALTQLRRAGVSVDAVRAEVDGQRWTRIRPGILVTFTGPPPPMTRIWSALLACGDGAALSHRTAAWLAGLAARLGHDIDVTIPAHRRIRPKPGIRLHRCHEVAGRVAPGRVPRQIRVVDTVADLIADARDVDQIVATVSTALSGRFCTPAALRASIAGRANLRHRADALIAIDDVAVGAHSALEVRYLRSVERAHDLPPGRRQVVVDDVRVDVRYTDERVRVELDGRRHHDGFEARFRDLHRDNIAAVLGDTTLRFGWHDVSTRACIVAAQVAMTLRRHGWTGHPRPCGSTGCGVLRGP